MQSGQIWKNPIPVLRKTCAWPSGGRVLDGKMSGIAVNLSDQYSEKVIRFISERIHEWDSREMIGKIENEVGGDLHMIRVNGVVVGAFIGLALGIIAQRRWRNELNQFFSLTASIAGGWRLIMRCAYTITVVNGHA